MWIVELFFAEKGSGGGFGMISGVPLIILGVSFILQGIIKKRKTPLRVDEKWKISLRLFVSIYTALYILVVIADFSENFNAYFNSTSGRILLILLLIYSFGFVFAWKKELISGIIFILWYAGVIYIFSTNSLMIPTTGPWIVFGMVVLVQAIFYLIYHFKYEVKKIGNKSTKII